MDHLLDKVMPVTKTFVCPVCSREFQVPKRKAEAKGWIGMYCDGGPLTERPRHPLAKTVLA